jgi:putative transposase
MVKKNNIIIIDDNKKKKDPDKLSNILKDNTYKHGKKKISYMIDSHPRNKNKISTDKLHFYNNNILQFKTPSFIEPVDVHNLMPFWTNYSKILSDKLWFSQMIESYSHLIASDISSTISIPHSSLTVIKHKPNIHKKNSPKTCSFQFLQPNIVDTQNIKYKIARKIKIFPSNDLKKYFKKCFGAHRFFYNKTIKHFNDNYNRRLDDINLSKSFGICCHIDKNKKCNNRVLAEEFGLDAHENASIFCEEHIICKLNFETNTNFFDLRDKLLIPNKYFDIVYDEVDLPKDLKELILKDEWQTEIPYDLKQGSIEEAIEAFKSCLTNKIRNKREFNLQYKTKKNKKQTFDISSGSINLEKKYIFKHKKKEMNIRINFDKKTERWLNKNKFKSLNKTITVLKENKYYYLCCCFEVNKEELKQPLNTVSIDPGIRTFATIYSPDGISGKLGDNLIEPLCRMGKRIDKLKSAMSKKENGKNKYNAKSRYNMKRRESLLRTKISQKIRDFHNKVINFLCINFKNIIIPEFDVRNMIKKKPKIIRKIKSKTVRKMLTLSHGKFMKNLEEYAERTGTQIIKPTEEYTSKTCGKCGQIDENLGSKKEYNCNKCKYKEDRDINGARNILIKVASGMMLTGLDLSHKDGK